MKNIKPILLIALIATITLLCACGNKSVKRNGPEIELLKAKFEKLDQATASLKEMMTMVDSIEAGSYLDSESYVSVYNVDQGEIFFLIPIYDKEHSKIISVGDCTLEGDVNISADTNAINAIKNLSTDGKYVLYVTGARYYASSETETIMLYQIFNDNLIQQYKINETYKDSTFEYKVDELKAMYTSDFEKIKFLN